MAHRSSQGGANRPEGRGLHDNTPTPGEENGRDHDSMSDTMCKIVIKVLVFAVLAAAATAQDHESWRIYGGDAAGSKYSSLDQIDATNVAKLEVAWIYRTGDKRRGSTIECNPIVGRWCDVRHVSRAEVDRSRRREGHQEVGVRPVCRQAWWRCQPWRYVLGAR